MSVQLYIDLVEASSSEPEDQFGAVFVGRSPHDKQGQASLQAILDDRVRAAQLEA